MASQDNIACAVGLKRPADDLLVSVRNKIIKRHTAQTNGGKQLIEKLLDDDRALTEVLKKLKPNDPSTTAQIVEEILPDHENLKMNDRFEIVTIFSKLECAKVDNDKAWNTILNLGVIANGYDEVVEHYQRIGFDISVAECSTDPLNASKQLEQSEDSKVPTYAAFCGASGSGKTCTMLWTQEALSEKVAATGQRCLKYYISCNPEDDETLFGYVKSLIAEKMDMLLSKYYSSLDACATQCKSTCLVLVLDEVQSRFNHKCYHELPASLKQHFDFGKVVLLVGSTAISPNVCRQPTSQGEVLNIRMKPLHEQKMQPLLEYHLRRIRTDMPFDVVKSTAEKLFDEMPVLWDLMSNHRCAFLTATVLSELLGTTTRVTEIPNGWGQGHSTTLVAMVACKYRGLNGMKNKSQTECRRLMIESLALLAVQSVVPEDQGVDKMPDENSLATHAKEVVEIGLVERAVLPDEKVNDRTKVKVDGQYEFQMSPALTLVCVTALFPSIEGTLNADDHFEALVATLMVAMRYAQTNVIFPIHRLERAVPYSGSEEHKFYRPTHRLDECCFINGPQAPYGDLMVAGAQKGDEVLNKASHLVKAISDQPGPEIFPRDPLLVQCKRSSVDTAECSFDSEFAKMGFKVEEVEEAGRRSKVLSSPADNPYPDTTSKNHNQYATGKWLTDVWVKNNNHEASVSIAFATNKMFRYRDNLIEHVQVMEAEGNCDYAWQKLYPMIQLVREERKFQVVGREKCN